MRSEFTKHNRAKCKKDHGNSPKLQRFDRFFPKPNMVDQCIAIPLGNVICRVEFKDPAIGLRNHSEHPKDRGEPEPKLNHHADQLTQITKENHNRTGNPRNPEQKDHRSEKIIENLEPVEAGHIAVVEKHSKHKKDEETMDNKC